VSDLDALTAFLSARLDEDEAAAKAAASVAGPDWHHDHFWPEDGSSATTMIFSAAGSPLADTLHRDDEEMAPFITRHDPARVLREIEAGRRILARYRDCLTRMEDPDYPQGVARDQAREYEDFVLPNLATAWSEHPGFREDWDP